MADNIEISNNVDVKTSEQDKVQTSSANESLDHNYAIIKKKVFDILLAKLSVTEDKISLDSHFVNDLGADSLDQVEMIMAMEEEFNCEIKEQQAEKLTTIKSLIDYLLSEVHAGKIVINQK